MADAPNADVGMLKPVDATAGAATSGKADAGAGANVTAVTVWPALALAAVVAVAAAAAASALATCSCSPRSRCCSEATVLAASSRKRCTSARASSRMWMASARAAARICSASARALLSRREASALAASAMCSATCSAASRREPAVLRALARSSRAATRASSASFHASAVDRRIRFGSLMLDGWFAADGLLKAEPSASPMRDHLRLRCGSIIGLISLGDALGAMFSGPKEIVADIENAFGNKKRAPCEFWAFLLKAFTVKRDTGGANYQVAEKLGS